MSLPQDFMIANMRFYQEFKSYTTNKFICWLWNVPQTTSYYIIRVILVISYSISSWTFCFSEEYKYSWHLKSKCWINCCELFEIDLPLWVDEGWQMHKLSRMWPVLKWLSSLSFFFAWSSPNEWIYVSCFEVHCFETDLDKSVGTF